MWERSPFAFQSFWPNLIFVKGHGVCLVKEPGDRASSHLAEAWQCFRCPVTRPLRALQDPSQPLLQNIVVTQAVIFRSYVILVSLFSFSFFKMTTRRDNILVKVLKEIRVVLHLRKTETILEGNILSEGVRNSVIQQGTFSDLWSGRWGCFRHSPRTQHMGEVCGRRL